LLTIEERARDIYKKYIEVICPYIIQYELLDNTFPVEILNEIRAIFTHLSKYYLSDDILIKDKNISKAEGHIKRSILDCYKYICMAYDDKYAEFNTNYKYVDLSLVDNGEFLPKLLETHEDAIKLMLDARKSDLLITSDDETGVDEAYEKYEKAFIKYSSVNDIISSSYKKIETLKRKVVFKTNIGWIVGIIGCIIGIVGIIFTIIF
jgi:hypothetical protein